MVETDGVLAWATGQNVPCDVDGALDIMSATGGTFTHSMQYLAGGSGRFAPIGARNQMMSMDIDASPDPLSAEVCFGFLDDGYAYYAGCDRIPTPAGWTSIIVECINWQCGLVGSALRTNLTPSNPIAQTYGGYGFSVSVFKQIRRIEWRSGPFVATSTPTSEPSADPTSSPTSGPTARPTAWPTGDPTAAPTLSPAKPAILDSSTPEFATVFGGAAACSVLVIVLVVLLVRRSRARKRRAQQQSAVELRQPAPVEEGVPGGGDGGDPGCDEGDPSLSVAEQRAMALAYAASLRDAIRPSAPPPSTA